VGDLFKIGAELMLMGQGWSGHYWRGLVYITRKNLFSHQKVMTFWLKY